MGEICICDLFVFECVLHQLYITTTLYIMMSFHQLGRQRSHLPNKKGDYGYELQILKVRAFEPYRTVKVALALLMLKVRASQI